MNNFGEQINLIINNIADKLGIAAEKLYPALIRQAYIDGITSLVWLMVSIVGFATLLYYEIKWFKKPEYEENTVMVNYTGIYISKVTIGLILMFLFFLTIVFNLNTALTGLLNPNWYIVKEVLSQIK